MKGIDVAKWNIITDYAAVKKAGVEFAITKVINKSNTNDSLLYTHIKGFEAAGIDCNMGYTYSYADTTAKAATAATAYVKYAKEVSIDFMWLDLEDVCMRGLGQKLINIINEYYAIANAGGLEFGIYTYASYYNSYIKPYISQLNGIPFWIARYPSATRIMKITDSVPTINNLPIGIAISGWQYTSKGEINGIKGYVDLDVWYENKTVKTATTTITADENPYPEPNVNVKYGTRGDFAKWVQWYLWRFGLIGGKTGIDGIIGNNSAAAIKIAQERLGLKADGIVGTNTRKVWKSVC